MDSVNMKVPGTAPRCATVLLALVSALVLQAQTTRVLFIGNSYTGYNNLPQLVVQMAAGAGETVVTGQSLPGGHTLEQHSTNANTLNLIRQGAWDHVVIQEQSQLPAFPDAQVAMQVLPFAQALVDSIRAYSPCADIAFYMTWGRENGDAQNCATFPPLCTYEGMQQRLRQGYLSMAQENQTACAPVGMAWSAVRGTHPDITLYNPDGSHPSLEGSYLAAATIFCTLFERTAMDLPFTADLPGATANVLRELASSTVLDSLSTWNIGILDPVAAFEVQTLAGSTFHFTSSEGSSGDSFWWDLGDGVTTAGQEVEHTYSESGNYVVRHAVTDDCGRSDTTELTIDVVATGVADHTSSSERAHWYFDGQVLRTNHPDMRSGVLHLIGSDGRTCNILEVQNGQADGFGAWRSTTGILWWRWSDGVSRHATGKFFMSGDASR